MLFDRGSTYFFVSMIFASEFAMTVIYLMPPILVSTPIGKYVIVTHVYRACPILFVDFQS